MLARTVIGAALAVVLSSTITTESSATTAAPAGRFALGDSVMLGAKPGLVARGFVVDAVESRQFSTAPSILRAKSAAGVLRRNVILALGTNGYIALSDCKAVVAAAGSGRRVFLVTNRVPRSWQSANNRVLRACDAYFAPKRVVVVDWYTYSSGHASWFYSDGIHLNSSGRYHYSILLDATLDALAL